MSSSASPLKDEETREKDPSAPETLQDGMLNIEKLDIDYSGWVKHGPDEARREAVKGVSVLVLDTTFVIPVIVVTFKWSVVTRVDIF